MAKLTLGLDIGPVSIGWALVEEDCIVACGARVFPEGVEREKGREISKSAARRMARAMRRQIARRARRRRQLRKALVRAGLLPPVALLPRASKDRDVWETSEYKSSDPLDLRAKALKEPLKPYDLGRALLHLSQRRGFQSNRRTDRAQAKENSALLQEISELEQKLEGRTLAQYLTDQRGADKTKYHLTRLRGAHTRRSMFKNEFDAIWNSQSVYHPAIMTDALKHEVSHAIFFQRNLKPPGAGLIGKCELYPRLPRCPRADRRAQRFRLFQEVNNLRVIDPGNRSEPERRLTEDERRKLIDFLFRKKERTFDEIRKLLFSQHESVLFNLERGERTKLKGMACDAQASSKTVLGKTWNTLLEDQKDRLVSAVIDDDESGLRFVLEKLGIDADKAAALLEKLDVEDGYAAYSLSAIKKLLPHLEAGLPLTSRDATTPCALRAAGFLMPWEHLIEHLPFLPEPPAIANPIVRQALCEVHALVNAILKELVYRSGHTLSAVHIELAREAKGTAEQRARRGREMRANEARRAGAAAFIREYGEKPTRERIQRVLLWQEQAECCIYSGMPISPQQLLGGDVDIDHILPYSRSLDDRMMNKVLCFRDQNTAGPDRHGKGDRTPYEWLSQRNAEKYEAVLLRAKRLPYAKQRRFLQKELDLEDFFARQLVDTSYIATQVAHYVSCLAPDVVILHGGHTGELRQQWGLNTALRSDDIDKKNRDDHRHHTIDAIVIAVTDGARLQTLAKLRHTTELGGQAVTLDPPWPGFRETVVSELAKVTVSHRPNRHVRGALHKETIYGKTEHDGTYVVRKPLETMSATEIKNIRDKRIRNLALGRLRHFGIEARRGADKIPAEVWKEPLTMRSGIPVRKARVLVKGESISAIRGGTAFVAPGNTHHVCLFEQGGSKAARYLKAVSMLEAADRSRRGETIIQRVDPQNPEAKYVMSLSASECVLIEVNGKEDVYRFETAASTSGQMWFRHHTYAGKSSDKTLQVSKKPGTFRGRKVLIDRLGRWRWAND